MVEFTLPKNSKVAKGKTFKAPAGAKPETGGLDPGQLAAAYGITSLWARGFKGQGRSVALIEPGTALGPNPGKLSDCYGPYSKIHQALIISPPQLHRDIQADHVWVPGQAVLERPDLLDRDQRFPGEMPAPFRKFLVFDVAASHASPFARDGDR